MTNADPSQLLGNRRILVTGAAGFIGRSLVQALDAAGSEVFATDLAEKSPFGKGIVYEALEFRSPLSALKSMLDFGPEYVVHLACPPDGQRSLESEKSFCRWLAGTVDFFSELSRLPAVQGVVTIGSPKEYGNGPAPFRTDQVLKPLSAYSAAKAAVTAYANYFRVTCRLNVSVLRLATVYGPGQPAGGIVDAVLESVTGGNVLRMTPGEQIREFLYVQDAIVAIQHSLLLTKDPECFTIQVGSGESISILDLAKMIFAAEGAAPGIEAGAIPYRDSEVFDMRMDSRLFVTKSGWAPRVLLSEGLKRTSDWYKTRG